MANGSGLVSLLDLLLSKANKLVTVGLIIFFTGPTVLVGFFVWRMVEREDKAMTAITTMVTEHARNADENFRLIQTTLINFIAAQRDIENQRNALLFEMCLEISNDGPGRARCRQAIGR